MKLAFAVGMCILLTTIPLLADQGLSALPDLMTYSRSFSEAARFVEPGGNVVEAVVDYTKSEFTVPASMTFSINGVDSDRFRSYVLSNAPDIRSVQVVATAGIVQPTSRELEILDLSTAQLDAFRFDASRGRDDYDRELVAGNTPYLSVMTSGFDNEHVPTVGFPIRSGLHANTTILCFIAEFRPDARWDGANIYFSIYTDDARYAERVKSVGIELELQPGINRIEIPIDAVVVHPDDRAPGLDIHLSEEDLSRVFSLKTYLRGIGRGEFRVYGISARISTETESTLASTLTYPVIPTYRIDDFSDGDRLCDHLGRMWEFSGTHPLGYWEASFDSHGYYLPIGGGSQSGQQGVRIALADIVPTDYIGLYMMISNAALDDMRREIDVTVNGTYTRRVVVDQGDPEAVVLLFSDIGEAIEVLKSLALKVVSSDDRAWIQLYDVGFLSSPEQAFRLAGQPKQTLAFDSNSLDKDVTLFLIDREGDVFEWTTQAAFPIYNDSEMQLDASAALKLLGLTIDNVASIDWNVSSPINDDIADEVHVANSQNVDTPVRFDNPGIYDVALSITTETGQTFQSNYKTLVYYGEGTPFEVRGIAVGGWGYNAGTFGDTMQRSLADLMLLNPNLLRIDQSKLYSLSDWLSDDFNFVDRAHTVPYDAMGDIAKFAKSQDLAVMYAMQIGCYDCEGADIEIEGATEVGSRAEIAVSEGFFKPHEAGGYFDIILEMAREAERSSVEHINISVELNMLEWPGGRPYWTSLLEEATDVFTGEITTQTHNGEFIWWRSDWSYPWDDDYGIPYGSQNMSYISTSEYSRLPINSETSSDEARDMILEGYFDDTPDFIGIGETIKLMTETFSKPFLNAEYSSTTMASHGVGITTSNTSNELCISLVGHFKAMEHLIRGGAQFAGDVFWTWAGTLMNADYYSFHEFFKLRNARNYSKNMEIIRAYWEDQSLTKYLSAWSDD